MPKTEYAPVYVNPMYVIRPDPAGEDQTSIALQHDAASPLVRQGSAGRGGAPDVGTLEGVLVAWTAGISCEPTSTAKGGSHTVHQPYDADGRAHDQRR
jgi:hypothetical protein